MFVKLSGLLLKDVSLSVCFKGCQLFIVCGVVFNHAPFCAAVLSCHSTIDQHPSNMSSE